MNSQSTEAGTNLPDPFGLIDFMKQSNQRLSELDNDRVQDLPAVRSNHESDTQEVSLILEILLDKRNREETIGKCGGGRRWHTPQVCGISECVGSERSLLPRCSGHLPIDDPILHSE